METIAQFAYNFTWEEVNKHFCQFPTTGECIAQEREIQERYIKTNGHGDFDGTIDNYVYQIFDGFDNRADHVAEMIKHFRERFPVGTTIKNEGTENVVLVADSMDKSLWVYGYIHYIYTNN